MKSRTLAATALIATAFTTSMALAAIAPSASPKEAEGMVKSAVAYIKANGKDKALAEITSKQGQFRDRDLYLTVYRLDGTALAHGANEKMVGHNLIGFKDVDGKEFFRERMELAKAKGSFWQDYKFANPISKKVEPKTAYCERQDDMVVCGGVYK